MLGFLGCVVTGFIVYGSVKFVCSGLTGDDHYLNGKCPERDEKIDEALKDIQFDEKDLNRRWYE